MRNSCYLHAALSLFDYMSFAQHAIAAVTSNPIRMIVTLWIYTGGVCLLNEDYDQD